MALTVWILQTGEPLHCDAGSPRPMRAMNLANTLVSRGHRVVLWSSAFYHQEHRHRSVKAARIRVSEQLEIRLVPSPGYRRHLGPGRLFDHAVLALNLRRMLAAERERPAVGFVGYPPIEAAAVMVRWLRRRAVPSVVDVKDQWPELFLDPLPRRLRPLGRLAIAPYIHLGRRAMREATGLSSMSGSFLDWGLRYAGRSRTDADIVAPLSPPLAPSGAEELAAARRWWNSQGILESDVTCRVMYVGSHSSAFDFEAVREAAMQSMQIGAHTEFVLCGDGNKSGELREMMAGLTNVKFPGWIDHPKMEALAERSAMVLAPYRDIPNYSLNVPNKVIDALALGLPILTPLSGEVQRLVEEYDVGLRYGPGSAYTLADAVAVLAADPKRRARMSSNARRLYDDSFSHDAVYGALAGHLERLAQSAKAQIIAPLPEVSSA